MIKIAVVYHSDQGHTLALAEYVLKGANAVLGVKAELFNVSSVSESPELLNEFHAIIFGTPTYMGTVSAPFKSFMDASSKIWFAQGWRNKIAAGFTNSLSMSGDKLNTLMQLVIFASQHSMIWVSLGEMNESIADDQVSGNPSAINRIGSYLGAMAQSDNLSAEKSPPLGDLRTAQNLGKRVAEAAMRWNK